MASRNIFSATPTKKSRKTTEFVHGEVLGHCVVDGCNNAEVTRCCATFGGCKNYATNGCKFKISILSSPSPCTTCLVDIKPGVRCLGVPNPKAEKTASGKTAYVNTHLDWEDCLGHKVKLAKDGTTAFKFIEQAEAGDDRIGVPCVRCDVAICETDYLISTYQPAAIPPLPENKPLHAKKCARDLFEDNLVQFVDNMMLEGLNADKLVKTDTLTFDF